MFVFWIQFLSVDFFFFSALESVHHLGTRGRQNKLQSLFHKLFILYLYLSKEWTLFILVLGFFMLTICWIFCVSGLFKFSWFTWGHRPITASLKFFLSSSVSLSVLSLFVVKSIGRDFQSNYNPAVFTSRPPLPSLWTLTTKVRDQKRRSSVKQYRGRDLLCGLAGEAPSPLRTVTFLLCWDTNWDTCPPHSLCHSQIADQEGDASILKPRKFCFLRHNLREFI